MFVIVRKKEYQDQDQDQGKVTYEVFGGFGRSGYADFSSLTFVSIGTSTMIFTTRYAALAYINKIRHTDDVYLDQVIFATRLDSILDLVPESEFDSQEAIEVFEKQDLLA